LADGAEDVGQVPIEPVAYASGSDGVDASDELIDPGAVQVLIRQCAAAIEVGVGVIAIVDRSDGRPRFSETPITLQSYPWIHKAFWLNFITFGSGLDFS